ncbi:hypothetical protein CEW83_20030 [Parazoarcus communis]|uniref:YqjK-like protein n=1 Tax=Parazoarcus communis TaxID=41977 RepID=A0A2U8GW31_9RHOO|nr:YqjK-like family protein [Parazoarcus communis]AWI77236.1 hypothetical protein CEW83_20030 [Parazoarcus communis]|tara:strand:- start:8540 stop:8905 length:366 start_codon:yes stop_codon:yes gene_type:complete
MNPRLIEFALRKQRLQINAERQRDNMVRHLEGVESILDTVDEVRDGVGWARKQAPILSGAALLLIATRPRQAWRLAKRVGIAWLMYRRMQGGSGARVSLLALPLARRLLERMLRSFAGSRA